MSSHAWGRAVKVPRPASTLCRCSSPTHSLNTATVNRQDSQSRVTKRLGEVASPDFYWLVETLLVGYEGLPEVTQDIIIIIINPIILLHLALLLTLGHGQVTVTLLSVVVWCVLDVSVDCVISCSSVILVLSSQLRGKQNLPVSCVGCYLQCLGLALLSSLPTYQIVFLLIIWELLLLLLSLLSINKLST